MVNISKLRAIPVSLRSKGAADSWSEKVSWADPGLLIWQGRFRETWGMQALSSWALGFEATLDWHNVCLATLGKIYSFGAVENLDPLAI